jgi:acetyl-CoA C-acetyltransferase
VDEVIMGNVLSAGVGQAPARQAALRPDCRPTVAALTINKVCGSGLKAVMLADQAIRAGDAELIVAGGMESMSRAPHLLAGARQGWKFGDQKVVDSMLHDGLWCAFENVAMGAEADYIAASRGIAAPIRTPSPSKAIAGRWLRRRRAFCRRNRARHGRRGKQPWSRATKVRAPTPARSARPAAARRSIRAGTVTAGNASQLSDGAAAVVVAGEATARGSESPIKARIVAAATSGVAPKEIFIAPVSAIERCWPRRI